MCAQACMSIQHSLGMPSHNLTCKHMLGEKATVSETKEEKQKAGRHSSSATQSASTSTHTDKQRASPLVPSGTQHAIVLCIGSVQLYSPASRAGCTRVGVT